jgi:hypothetical protein
LLRDYRHGVVGVLKFGLANGVWDIEDLAGLVEEKELEAIQKDELKRGKYRTKL